MKVKLKTKILRENIKQETRLNWKVTTDPANFLALARLDKSGNMQARAASYGKFDPEKAEYMQLSIDPNTGRVTYHEGRARSQVAINSGVKQVELTIQVDQDKTDKKFTWNDLPEYFLPEDGRDGYVAKSAFTPKEETVEATFNNILKLRGKNKVFEREVIMLPSGKEYVKQDPNKDIATFIGMKYSENFLPVLRISAGLPNIPGGKMPLSVMDAYRKYWKLISNQYTFTDDQGELKLVEAYPPMGTVTKFDRPAVGNVTISLK